MQGILPPLSFIEVLCSWNVLVSLGCFTLFRRLFGQLVDISLRSNHVIAHILRNCLQSLFDFINLILKVKIRHINIHSFILYDTLDYIILKCYTLLRTILSSEFFKLSAQLFFNQFVYGVIRLLFHKIFYKWRNCCLRNLRSLRQPWIKYGGSSCFHTEWYLNRILHHRWLVYLRRMQWLL